MPLPAEDPPPGVPDWILTYGDMMSLLLCFFVLLSGMSEIKDPNKKNALIESILRQFADPDTVEEFLATRQVSLNANTNTITKDSQSQRGTLKTQARQSARGRRGNEPKVQTIRDGRRTIIGGPALFEPGSASLSANSREALREIAEALRGKRHLIEVRGYEIPDEQAAEGPRIDPKDLAFARARAVAEFLIQEGKLRPELLRIAVGALAESAAPPTLATGEPMRERVDVMTLESITTDYVPLTPLTGNL